MKLFLSHLIVWPLESRLPGRALSVRGPSPSHPGATLWGEGASPQGPTHPAPHLSTLLLLRLHLTLALAVGPGILHSPVRASIPCTPAWSQHALHSPLPHPQSTPTALIYSHRGLSLEGACRAQASSL